MQVQVAVGLFLNGAHDKLKGIVHDTTDTDTIIDNYTTRHPLSRIPSNQITNN